MNKIIKNTGILMAITLVAGALLGLVYEVTKIPIAQAQEDAKQEAYRTVLADADTFVNEEGFKESKAQKILNKAGYVSDDISEVVVGQDTSGETVGYVITVTSHEGYGGDIQISVGIETDGTVKGIEMLSISENVGLGLTATEADYTDQFTDKTVEKFSSTKSGEEGDDKIDALSGATITTNAVTNAVDSALAYFQEELGGSVNE